MLVGAADHQHLVAGHPLVAAEDVGRDAEAGDVADVARAVGVGPGDRGQDVGGHRSTLVIARAPLLAALTATAVRHAPKAGQLGGDDRGVHLFLRHAGLAGDRGDRVLAGQAGLLARGDRARPARPGVRSTAAGAAPATTRVISPRTSPAAAHSASVGQRAALHLFIGLGQLAAHRGRPVGAERGGQIGQRRGQPVRRLEEDQRARLAGQPGQRAGGARRPCAAGTPRSRTGRPAAPTRPAPRAPRTGRAAPSPRARPRPRPPPAGSPGQTPTACRRRSPPARPRRLAARRAAAAAGPPRSPRRTTPPARTGARPRSAHSRCSRRVSSAAITGGRLERRPQPGRGVGRVAQRGRGQHHPSSRLLRRSCLNPTITRVTATLEAPARPTRPSSTTEPDRRRRAHDRGERAAAEPGPGVAAALARPAPARRLGPDRADLRGRLPSPGSGR